MANAAVGRWVGCGQGMPTKRDSGSEFAGGGFRGIGPALAGNVGQVGLSRCARGVSGCGRSYARFGPVPRLLGAASCRTGTRVVCGRGAAGPESQVLRTRDAEHPGSSPHAHLLGGLGGNRPRMSCCLRYHSRRVRESMVSLKSLKLAMLRAPSMSSFRDLLRSPLASVAQPR